MAQGQFGPPLAATNLTYSEVKGQVRNPRDKMPAFDRQTVSDRDLADIYAWLRSLPTAMPTTQVTLSPAESTVVARDRFYPVIEAEALLAAKNDLDESALQIEGNVTAINAQGRFTEVMVNVVESKTSVTVLALYDTALARRPFPAAVGDHVTLYGIGAEPVRQAGSQGTATLLPRMQILEVVIDEEP